MAPAHLDHPEGAHPPRPIRSAHPDPYLHKGAREGDRPEDPQHGNPHGTALNEDGLPDDAQAIAEDVLGAEVDETQG